jgi:hypothetical protein
MSKSESDPLRVVVHLREGGLLKGFLHGGNGVLDTALSRGSGSLPSVGLQLKSVSGDVLEVDLEAAKAVFVVNSFEGRPDYTEIKFFHETPGIAGLWVRVKFLDNEVTEGIVQNSLDFVNNPGFFMKPPDPQSNNRRVYVLKKFLLDFKVLGIQSEF